MSKAIFHLYFMEVILKLPYEHLQAMTVSAEDTK